MNPSSFSRRLSLSLSFVKLGGLAVSEYRRCYVLLAVGLLAQAAAAQTVFRPRGIEPEKVWIEERTDKDLDNAPHNAGDFGAGTIGFVVTEASWQDLWRAWRDGEPPQINFSENFVLVVTWPARGRNTVDCTVDRLGDLKVSANSSGRPRRGNSYLLAVLPRAKIQSVQSYVVDPAGLMREPPLVVALAPLDEWRSHLEHVMRSAGAEREIDQLERHLDAPLLAGLDWSRPMGLTTTIGDGKLLALGFLPLRSFDAFVQNLKRWIPAEVGPDGIMRTSFCAAKSSGDWLYISYDSVGLLDLPPDPIPLLEGLDQQNLAAVRIRFRHLTPWAEMLVQYVGRNASRDIGSFLHPYGKVIDDQIAAFCKGMVTVLPELDQSTLTLQHHIQDNSAEIELRVAARPQTKLAARLNGLPLPKSDFCGIELPNSQFSVRLSTALPGGPQDSIVPLFESTVATLFSQLIENEQLSDSQKERAQIFHDLVMLAAQGDCLDGAATLLVDSTTNQGGVVAGIHVENTQQMRAQLRQLHLSAKQEEQTKGEVIDVESVTYRDVVFANLPRAMPPWTWRQIEGEPMDLAVGFRGSDAYVARANNALVLLQQLVDRSAEENIDERQTLLKATIRVFELWLSINEELPVFLQAKDNDRAQLRIHVIPDGLTATLKCEDLVVRIAGFLINSQFTEPD